MAATVLINTQYETYQPNHLKSSTLQRASSAVVTLKYTTASTVTVTESRESIFKILIRCNNCVQNSPLEEGHQMKRFAYQHNGSDQHKELQKIFLDPKCGFLRPRICQIFRTFAPPFRSLPSLKITALSYSCTTYNRPNENNFLSNNFYDSDVQKMPSVSKLAENKLWDLMSPN